VAGGKVTEEASYPDLKATQLVSFGVDNGGDVYAVDLGGGRVFRIDGPALQQPAPTPTPAPTTTTTATSTTTAPPATTTSTTATTAPPVATTTTTTSTGPPGTVPGRPGGLRAEYFDNPDLTGKSHVRTDPRVYLDYEHAPFQDFGPDQRSARWAGELRVDKPGDYTLIVTSDDGARLWVDGKPTVDAWAPHAVRDDAKKLTLTAGRHDIRMEYVDNQGVAFAKLSWAGPGIPREVIPGPNLYPAPVVA